MGLTEIHDRRTQGTVQAFTDALQPVARQAKTDMLARVALGQDIEDTPFAPPRPSYAKRTGKAAIDMKARGDMLREVRLRRRSSGWSITLRTAHGRGVGLAHQRGANRRRGGRLAQRRWFGVSRRGRQSLIRTYGQQMRVRQPDGQAERLTILLRP